MAQVKFNSSVMQAQISSIQSAFESLNSKITEIKNKSQNVSMFWSSKEASNFSNGLAKVEKDISAFIEKYNKYMSFLDSVIVAQEANNSNLVASINAIASKEG